MSNRLIIVSTADHIAHLQLNRPDVFNAMDRAIVDELYAAFSELDENPDVRTIIISGAGKAFCAGGDVSFLQVINSKSQTEIRGFLHDLFQRVSLPARMEKPVIAALHGYVMGAGFSLALCCDLRLAARNTILGAEFPKMGIIPEIGCTHLLPKLVGMGRAKELILSARRIDAEEALRIGLVNRVVSEDFLIKEAFDLARKIADLPPLAISWSKEALHRGAVVDLSETIKNEADINALCYGSGDHKEATAAFREKRKPVFTGK